MLAVSLVQGLFALAAVFSAVRFWQLLEFKREDYQARARPGHSVSYWDVQLATMLVCCVVSILR